MITESTQINNTTIERTVKQDEQNDPNSLPFKIRNFFILTLPLLTFIYTSSEGWLLAFYEIQILSSDTQ